jgi:hypothetical protein
MPFSDIFRPYRSQTVTAGASSQAVALDFETDIAVARSLRVAVGSGGPDVFVRFGDANIEADEDGILICAGAAPSFFRIDRAITHVAVKAAAIGTPSVNIVTGQGA